MQSIQTDGRIKLWPIYVKKWIRILTPVGQCAPPSFCKWEKLFFDRSNILTTVEQTFLPSNAKMRALSEEEMRVLLAKLADYMGSLKNLINPADDSDDSRMVFRLHGARVFYCRLALANLATSVARDNLSSLGICLGKFTKSGKFRLVRLLPRKESTPSHTKC